MVTRSPLADESLSLQEVQAFIEAYDLQKGHALLRNKIVHALEQTRAKRYLQTLDFHRIQKYLADSQTRILPFKAIQLSQWVKKLRPQTIVEFGGGGSTILFAELLHKYGIDGRVITLEQSPEYFDRITNALPDVFTDRVDVHLCTTRYERINGYRCLMYDLPDLPSHIDFAYIDGPSPQENTPIREGDIFFDGDLYQLAQKRIFCSFAINDGRWFNYHFFRSQLRGTYRLRPTQQYRSFLIEHRTDKPSVWAWSRFWKR